jgi:hypothetical protein
LTRSEHDREEVTVHLHLKRFVEASFGEITDSPSTITSILTSTPKSATRSYASLNVLYRETVNQEVASTDLLGEI